MSSATESESEFVLPNRNGVYPIHMDSDDEWADNDDESDAHSSAGSGRNRRLASNDDSDGAGHLSALRYAKEEIRKLEEAPPVPLTQHLSEKSRRILCALEKVGKDFDAEVTALRCEQAALKEKKLEYEYRLEAIGLATDKEEMLSHIPKELLPPKSAAAPQRILMPGISVAVSLPGLENKREAVNELIRAFRVDGKLPDVGYMIKTKDTGFPQVLMLNANKTRFRSLLDEHGGVASHEFMGSAFDYVHDRRKLLHIGAFLYATPSGADAADVKPVSLRGAFAEGDGKIPGLAFSAELCYDNLAFASARKLSPTSVECWHSSDSCVLGQTMNARGEVYIKAHLTNLRSGGCHNNGRFKLNFFCITPGVRHLECWSPAFYIHIRPDRLSKRKASQM